jgi:hypothetical protein
MSTISFSGHMDDVGMQIATNGFSTELWTPEFGWEMHEAEASEPSHPPQLLAALQCFLAFFVKPVQRVWVHLAAEMQAGKTGVVTALIRLILKNAAVLNIRPTRIFILTGMNDNAWKKQTRDRLPKDIRQNVHHNGGLVKFAKSLTSLAAGGDLANVLIVIDESHIASARNNRPNLVYQQVARLCPQEKWQENNIRFLTISATDPAKVLEISDHQNAQVVRLQTTDDYQSVEKLAAAGRMRSLETFKDVHEVKGIAELRRCITEEFADQPMYHIIRARQGKTDVVIAKLRATFPDAVVRKFDSEEKIMSRGSATDSSSGLSEIEDINEILSEKPDQHTFIVIKNMFYAAKTLNDEFVGVLWDRLGGKDDTNLQSLLGRACGYGKSERTVIYASDSTVDNYSRFWKELCSDSKMPHVIPGVPISTVAKKMAGVTARTSGAGVKVSAAATATAPLSGGGTSATAAGDEPAVRNKANEDDFAHSYREYSTLDAAKFKNMRTPKQDEQGFYLTSTTGSPQRLSYASVITMCTGKKTSNLPWGGLDVGKSSQRLYVAYKNISDPTSALFIVRTLTRLR